MPKALKLRSQLGTSAAGTKREVRLGSVQRHHLELCAIHPQRRSPGNPTMRALAWYGFVKSEQHFSERTKRPTLDRLFTITDKGSRYLATGRDRG